MAFVKLDCGMLDSTLWIDRAARELFITALLMAEPFELNGPVPQMNVKDLGETGFIVPSGWYGFVAAAGSGIVRRCGMDAEPGLLALERLGQPESESRTPDFDGRRMVRVNGGYIILNYDKYRSKDHTASERSRRYRERKASRVSDVTSRVTGRSATQAEGEAEGQKKKQTGKKEEVPAVLNTEAFRAAWEDWQSHRREIKKPLTATSIKSQLAQFTEWGERRAIDAIRFTIQKGWQGLREDDSKPRKSKSEYPEPPHDDSLVWRPPGVKKI